MEGLEKYINELIVVGGVILGIWAMTQTFKQILSLIKEFKRGSDDKAKVNLIDELSTRVHETYHKAGNIQQQNEGILTVVQDIDSKISHVKGVVDNANLSEMYILIRDLSESRGEIAVALNKVGDNLGKLDKTSGEIKTLQKGFYGQIIGNQNDIKDMVRP